MRQEQILENSSLNLQQPEHKETACDPKDSPWIGQRWAKYPVEIDHIVEPCEEQDQEHKNVWAGQQWNKYV